MKESPVVCKMGANMSEAQLPSGNQTTGQQSAYGTVATFPTRNVPRSTRGSVQRVDSVLVEIQQVRCFSDPQVAKFSGSFVAGYITVSRAGSVIQPKFGKGRFIWVAGQ